MSPTKAELGERLAEMEARLDAVVDVLEDPDIEDEEDRVTEALEVADPKTYYDGD